MTPTKKLTTKISQYTVAATYEEPTRYVLPIAPPAVHQAQTVHPVRMDAAVELVAIFELGKRGKLFLTSGLMMCLPHSYSGPYV